MRQQPMQSRSKEQVENCDKSIRCKELRNGEIAYGDLIIVGGEEDEQK